MHSCCGAYDVRRTEWPSAGVLSAIPVQTPWTEMHYPLPIYWGNRKMCADLISSWIHRSSDLTHVNRTWLLGEPLAIGFGLGFGLLRTGNNQGRLLDAPYISARKWRRRRWLWIWGRYKRTILVPQTAAISPWYYILIVWHNVVDVNSVGISQTSALHQCVRLVLLCTGKWVSKQ